MSPHVTHALVAAIVAEPDAVHRNLRITEAYRDISSDFRDVVGIREANWCTFAAWASATAGDFIQKDLLRNFFHEELASSRVRALFDPLSRQLLGRRDGLLGIAGRITDEVAKTIADGNRLVFEELAPEFVAFIDLYAGGERPSVEQVRSRFSHLREGPSDAGGQTRLKLAFETYARAALAPAGSDARAQLALMGSVLIGFHEQIRLQRAIQDGLDAPFDTLLQELASLLAAAALLPPLRTRLSAWLKAHLLSESGSVHRDLNELYRELLTFAAMHVRQPGRPARLSRDMQRSGALQPNVCRQSIIEHTPDLGLLMETFGMLSDGEENSGARDWTRMTDRMPYILDLFRSNQHEPKLFDLPFDPDEVRLLKKLRAQPASH